MLAPTQTCPVRLFDLEIMRMISDQITLHSVQLPLFIIPQENINPDSNTGP